ncbi:hypothetical protein RJ55_03121 [Drechmeria coniospora]|nr:hypothetical protein RJ55_03121 [Drechmeria coniospora]
MPNTQLPSARPEPTAGRITSLFAALCIHTICIRRGTGVARCIAEHRARMCLLCLREIQKYWRINNNVLDLFLRYLDRSIAERLDASSHAGTGGHDVDATVNNGAAKSDAAPPARVGAGVQVGVSDAGHALPPSSPTLGQSHSRDGLFEDPYFTLVNGHWEGDDALGDLSLFLQADAFSSPEKGLGLSDRAL